MTDAWLGRDAQATARFAEFVESAKANSNDFMLYSAACISAQMSRIQGNGDLIEASTWKQRAIECLQLAYTQGFVDDAEFHQSIQREWEFAAVCYEDTGIDKDMDFIPLWDDANFQRLWIELTGDRYYAAVCGHEDRFEPCVGSYPSLDEVSAVSEERVVAGYRPVAIAACVLPGHSGPSAVMSWHRPRRSTYTWDPVQRTSFVEEFREWHGYIEGLRVVLAGVDNSALRSGISLALGSVREVSTEISRTWEPVIAKWHTDDPDSGVHSASSWGLRSRGLRVPVVESTHEARVGFNWHVTEMGLTLVRIPAGHFARPLYRGSTSAETIVMDREFWISDCEVTAGQYLAFLNDKSAEKPGEPDELVASNKGDPRLPARGISWYDAVLFCNWLSRKEGREPVYRKEGKETIEYFFRYEHYALRVVPGADGYRLPTLDEWVHACRALTTTVFSFGDDEDLLERYVVCERNFSDGPDSVGSRLCNAWGLFDMYGNVEEWCQDVTELGSSTSRQALGGDFSSSAEYCFPSTSSVYQPDRRQSGFGFRVARDSCSQ